MSKYFVTLFLFSTLSLFSQIGLGTSAPETSSILDLTSTNKGFLLPRMTHIQKTRISSPVAGLWIWCTDCGNNGEMQVYDGVNWTNMIGNSASISTILDKLGTSSICAFSLRKLRASYVGSAIRVVRSTDNTQQDIGFDVNGNLNQSALLAFVGSGNGFVTTWYDQSGNGRNATTQNTGDNRIVHNGVIDMYSGKAGIVSGILSSTTSLLEATIPTNTTTLTANAVSTMDSVNQDLSRLLSLKIAAAQGFYDDSNVNRGALFVSSNSNTRLTGIRAYAFQSTATFSLGSKFTATTIYDGTNNTMYLNGTSFAPVASSGTFTQQALQLFNGDYMNTRPYKGTTTEVILFNVALTNTQRQVLDVDQGLYYSLTPSISYFSTNVYTKGAAIPPLNPINVGGAPTTYAISPILPMGLNFNTSTGAITGSPLIVSSATFYTVTATNNYGATKTNFSITVNDLAPSALMYSSTSFVFSKGTVITPISGPTNTGGAVLSYSISPVLPSGLNINSVTGEITGTPQFTSTTNTYTITAFNSGGNTTTSIEITINDVFLLDLAELNLVTLSSAYSLRKLRVSYNGSAIRVVRSTDNTQQDIGFDINGNLNHSALLAFVGNGNGFVTRWYDQSGNGRNATTQNTGDNRIVHNGVIDMYNGKAGIVSGILSSTTSLLEATIPTNTTTLTANAVSTLDSGNQDLSRLLSLKIAAAQGFYDDSNVNRGALFVSSNSNTRLTGIRAYAFQSTAAFSLGSKFTATTIYDGTNNTMYLNGTSFAPVASSGTFTQQALQLFNGDYMNTRPYKGTTTEVILFNVALTNTQRQVLETNQIAYYSISY